MRLIDADKFEAYSANGTDLEGEEFLAYLSGMQRVLEDIDAAPTIDSESLRPRGTWEGTADGYADGELVYDTWTCSECGYTVDTDDPDDLTKFCPNCGAKMEGGHNP